MEDIIELVRARKVRKLKDLSDELLLRGFVDQEKKKVRLSVIVRALSKIVEKNYYLKDRKYWENFLSRLEDALKAGDLERAEKIVIELDRHFGRYKEDIIKYAKIRRGSTLYAWGVSLTKVSEMLGVPEYELMHHIGKTKMVDEEGTGKPALERLKDAEEIL